MSFKDQGAFSSLLGFGSWAYAKLSRKDRLVKNECVGFSLMNTTPLYESLQFLSFAFYMHHCLYGKLGFH
jgi:hypothetical protein